MRWPVAPFTIAALVALAPAAEAQALLKPNGQNAAPLILKTLRADVKITGPLATTTLTLCYANPYSQRIEADFLYQLPDGAVATGFAYWYGDEKVPAQIVEKARAAAIYKAITTRQRDPALVELVGKNKLRARIFPVEPNADLRIELVYVSALPRDRDGSALFTLPLPLDKEAPALDECSAQVTVTGWPTLQNNLGLEFLGGVLHYRASHLRPDKNLRIRVQGTSDSLLAAPSGGRDGFFALTSLQKNAPSPAHSYAVHRQAFGAGWLVTGRYRQATQEPEPNGPAVKLWAAQELQALGKGARERAIALSMRHGIVSAHTSWLAIPRAERQRYEAEKREADIQTTTDALVQAIRRRSQTKALRARLASLCQGTERTPQECLQDAFHDELLPLAESAVQGDTRARQRLTLRAQRIGIDPQPFLKEARMPLAEEELGEALADLRQLFEAGKEGSPQARKRVAQVRALEREVANPNALHVVYPADVRQATQNLAKAQLDSLPESPNDHRLLARLSTLTGIAPANYIAQELSPLVSERIQELENKIWSDLGASDTLAPDVLERRLTESKGALAPLLQRSTSLGSPNRTPEQVVRDRARDHVREVAERYTQALLQDNPEGAQLQRARLQRMEQLAQEPANLTQTSLYQQLLMQLAQQQRSARRDRTRIARLEELLQKMERPTGTTRPALPQPYVESEADERLRTELLTERRKPQPNPTRLRALAQQLEQLTAQTKSQDYAKTRVELLLTDTELDTLENQPTPDPRQLATLQQRSKTLHARFGDPLLTIDAPRDAQLVVARFADGSVKPLAWSPERQRWELRFDVPPHARPGAWDIQVTIVHADGHHEGRVFPVTVDMDAPKAQGTLTPLPDGRMRLDVRATPDARRATAFFLGAEPVELTPTGQPGGFFTLLDTLPHNLRVVVTDRAHNRVELTEFSRP